MHILEPFFELKTVSKPEKYFVEYLEKNEDFIHWWYKNGDKGKEHFAVPYQNSRGETSLFYVDFIVCLKSGKIGLFDTKTLNSDPEAPAKHNALLEYCQTEKKRNLLGSVVLFQMQNETPLFRYSPQKISNTHEMQTWDFLHLENI